MDIKTLRYFLAASETENLSRAAERLNVVQSALSHRIKALEDELGVELFERHGRSIRLSFIGSVFRDDAKRILQNVELAKVRVERAAEGKLGTLRIGFQQIACRNRLVPATLHEYRERSPLVELTLTSSSGDVLLKNVRNNELDGAFLYLPSQVQGFDIIRLAKVDWVLVLPRNHRFADRASLSLNQLGEERFIWLQRHVTPMWHAHMLDLCRRGGLEPKIALEAADETMTITLVAADMGIAFALEDAQAYWPNHMVVFKPIKDFSLPLSLCFVSNPENQLPSLQGLMELLPNPAGGRAQTDSAA